MKPHRLVLAALSLLLMLAALFPLAGTANAQGPDDFVQGETSVVVPAAEEATLSFTSVPPPVTIPETGAPEGDVTDSGRGPWLLIVTGMIMLTSAGFLITRYQEQ